MPTAYCNVRPPGHPAEKARSTGFCFVDNAAVAAAHAMAQYGIEWLVEGRVVSPLEGGYAVDALVRSAVEHIHCMMRV